MNTDLVVIAVLAGAANWAFRALPILFLRGQRAPGGMMSRFLAATGPAAIATLFVAAILPQIWPAPRDLVPLLAGSLATVLAFWPRRSVPAGTLAGAAVYGLAVWALS